MHKIKRTFLKLLQNKITYKNEIVPVIIKDFPYDKTPCITITGTNRDKGNHRRQHITQKRPLSPHHDLYDEKNPHKLYPTLVEYTVKSYEITLNIWCDNEEQREIITNQVKDCLFYCMNHHRDYCVRYDIDTEICSTTGLRCASFNDGGFHGLRCQCPDPLEYDYCNLFTANGIHRHTVVIDPDYDQDEYDRREPLKRTLIDISLDYQDSRVIRSNPTLSATLGIEVTKKKRKNHREKKS